MSLLDDLNSQQRAAVTAGDGPVLIVAGPGTGKTKTLTARTAFLLDSGVPPSTITALTFTNKAAHEMRGRVTALVGKKSQLPRIATFHALGHEILSDQTDQPLRFISEQDRLTLIRHLAKDTDKKGLGVRERAQAISRFKNTPSHGRDQDLAQLAQRYDTALAEKGLHDFDDLLGKVHTLLSDDGALRSRLAERCRYLLVDEFQDTNQLQYELMRLFTTTSNLFVIGDPLQSIYGFRGASGDIFDQFKADFPDHTPITLGTNYRSAPEIVRLSNAIFPKAPQLQAHQKDPGRVQAMQVLNEYSEADWILQQIEQHIGGTDMLKSHHADSDQQKTRQFSDYAVLYRTHRLAKILEQKLAASGLPYQIVGEGSPYEQPLIKTILQALRFLDGGDPPVMKELSASRAKTLLQGIDAGQPLSRLVQDIVQKLALDHDEDDKRLLYQFVSTLVRFDTLPIADYLRHIDDIADQNFYDSAAQAITLLTIHAAKGLEFTHVFLLGAEEGVLPHIRKNKATDFDEERRLFYVAVTRAAQQLDVLHAKTRSAEPTKVSRFIETVPPEILPRTIDPDIQEQQRRLQKRRLKRAQQTLF